MGFFVLFLIFNSIKFYNLLKGLGFVCLALWLQFEERFVVLQGVAAAGHTTWSKSAENVKCFYACICICMYLSIYLYGWVNMYEYIRMRVLKRQFNPDLHSRVIYISFWYISKSKVKIVFYFVIEWKKRNFTVILATLQDWQIQYWNVRPLGNLRFLKSKNLLLQFRNTQNVLIKCKVN